MSRRPITEDDLQAFVDQALDPPRRAEVEAYLEAHPEVAGRIEGYRRQRAALRAAFAPVADEPLPPELSLARLIEARRRTRTVWWRAAAAALLLGLGGGAGWSLHQAVAPEAPAGPGGILALAQEAADSYAVYAPDRVQPVEIRADQQARLVAWASQRLQRPVKVPDLTASGFRFMGGRLVATPHGPAVLFMYDDDRGTRLVVLSRPMAVERDAPMAERSKGDVAGFTWAQQGIGYSLVGPLPPDRLHPLADTVRRQVAPDA
ncbi:Transmembrane transcriptional regulator (anti-sigma factor RsiW) [Tistlia consotensis]|uniref:Transmembrane transcriptional regulator (Anti-sigma factor RsiW) n=1 Tax=Tistlia consotensis USBA 355 TaxID=560819 RepID=A0A1Y6B429_9PROT|nr:anti-sigma factor [Tistlia consotensis]SME90729.1 Transmembrane transcriptional regulator (anti-sigma factor RsiW) [Tistlia consotensis USBA 355]SNR26907.1 Transmembrane transcriptional regulator (anti-sigma factor RsiW) [Tistlia consotensis]